MPVIHFYGPSMPKEKKEALVRSFARAASEATGIPAEKMITVLHETAPENVGLGERLLVDLMPK